MKALTLVLLGENCNMAAEKNYKWEKPSTLQAAARGMKPRGDDWKCFVIMKMADFGAHVACE